MTDSVSGILSALQQELSTLELVHSALEAESLGLSKGDGTSIERLIQNKEAALANHQRIMGQRPSASKDHAANPEVAALQDRLAALANECRELNQQNGILISKLSDRTKAALNVLQGTEDMTVVYSASGVEAAKNKGSRVLGKA
mgnify:FL=1